MSEHPPKVFYIGPSSFLRLYVEKLVKRDGGEVYTHPGDEDPHYLIEDLTPSAVLLDESFLALDWAQNLVKDSQIPVVLTGSKEQGAGKDESRPFFAKPYNDESFMRDLMKLVEGT